MRILVVDDHLLARKGICTVLGTGAGIEICGEAADGQAALEKAKELPPDVVIKGATVDLLEKAREQYLS